MIYISAPYTHKDWAVTLERMEAVHGHFLQLAEEMKMSVSPLIVGHQYIDAGMWTASHDFWLPYSEELLKVCSEVHVLKLDGWQESVGVQFELRIAAGLGLPIAFFNPRPK